MTEKEIDLVLNRQLASKPSFEPNTSAHLPTPSCCLDTRNKLVDQLEEKKTDIPICLIDKNVYSGNFSNFNQSDDDDDFQ